MIFGKADEFEDTKGVIRIRKWPNDKGKRLNNDLQNIKHKNKRSSSSYIYIDICVTSSAVDLGFDEGLG